MAELNDTPRGNRIHIAFFGLRNAGKSTLVNAFTGQPLAIVSDVPGTTTDPVSKAMEILPLGPCIVTDTAGLDDEGELGLQRVRKSLDVLAVADIAVWVGATAETEPDSVEAKAKSVFLDACRQRKVAVLEYRRGEPVEELKQRIAAVKLEDSAPLLLDGLQIANGRILCVVPVDESAPKGRLILPQQQVIREALDRGLVCAVCQPSELAACLRSGMFDAGGLVVTDSQAFGEVSRTVAEFRIVNPSASPLLGLTSFSILFARQKGDVGVFLEGLAALAKLRDGDTVLISEGCTHHRQCNDIGAVKIPKALSKLCGKRLEFVFSSGKGFMADGVDAASGRKIALVVHCGACMLTRRETLRRIEICRSAGIPIVNYGMVLGLSAMGGLDGLAGLESAVR